MDSILLGHAVYRPLLQALSRPGTVQPLPPAARARPLAAILGALADHQVTLHVAGDDGALQRELAWTTGCRRAPPEQADFLVFPRGASEGRLLRARRGSLEYPDGGATAIFAIGRCEPSGGRTALRGPGIRDVARPALLGLAEDELRALREANRAFPLGVDALFVDARGQVVGIPRSTRIEEG